MHEQYSNLAVRCSVKKSARVQNPEDVDYAQSDAVPIVLAQLPPTYATSATAVDRRRRRENGFSIVVVLGLRCGRLTGVDRTDG